MHRNSNITGNLNSTFLAAGIFDFWHLQRADFQHLFRCENTPYFTGKERDEETGYGYFGARYTDHELMTMWLSVDPMADKYPSISPYAYCAWNPVRVVDSNGMGCARFYQNSYSIDDELEAYARQGLLGDTWSSEEVREVYKTKYGLFWYGKNSQYSPTDKVNENNTLYQEYIGHPWIMYYGWEKDIVKERNK